MASGRTRPANHELTEIETVVTSERWRHNDNRIRSRRVMAVDLEHQVVMTSVYFDHENDASIRSYTLKNGETVTVTHKPSRMGSTTTSTN
jgi:hypothetical protein